MNKDFITKVKKEGVYLVALLALSIILFNVVFFKENPGVVVRTILSLYWLFVLPGFTVMYYWVDQLNFIERFVIGIFMGAAVIGIFSYYLGLIGLHVKYSGVVLPILFIGLGIIIIIRKIRK